MRAQYERFLSPCDPTAFVRRRRKKSRKEMSSPLASLGAGLVEDTRLLALDKCSYMHVRPSPYPCE